MEFEKLKREAVSLEVALDRIRRNNSLSYEWEPVRNKKGCLFEIGGHVKDGNLVFKASIPKFTEGKYQLYQNGYINHEYSINNQGDIEYPTFRSSHNLDDKKLIKWLDNTDFKIYTPRVEEIEVIEYTNSYKATL